MNFWDPPTTRSDPSEPPARQGLTLPLRSWAFWVSVVLHPLLMPTLLFVTLFVFVPELAAPLPPKVFRSLVLLVFMGTTLLPLFLCLLLLRAGTVRSLTMQRRGDRLLPIILTALVYTGVTYAFMSHFRLSQALVLAMAGPAVAVALAGLVSYFQKISLHMVGIGGVVGFVAGVGLRQPQTEVIWPLAGLIVLAGLVGTARLALQAHRPAEVLTGCLLGAGVCGLAAGLLH